MRILLVEDHTKLGDWLSKSLRLDGFAIDWMRDGVEADHVLLTQEYDAVVLDLALPRMDGLEVLRRLRARGSATPVLILTARTALEERVTGLNFGADDYLPKPFAVEELVARLNALIRRSRGKPAPVAKVGDLEFDSARRTFRLGEQVIALRPKEHALLEALILSAGKAVSKAKLHETLFELETGTSPEAVEVYVHRLRRHLEGTGATIVTLRGLGYVLEPRSR